MNKNISISILVSLLFPITLLIGEAIGTVVAELIHFIYRYIMFLNMSDWHSEITIRGLQGAIAGFIAAYVTVFVYKDFHFKSSLIIPAITLSLAIFSSLFMMFHDGDYFRRFTDLISFVASGAVYIYYLDDKRQIW